jgi:hypothetical protein
MNQPECAQLGELPTFKALFAWGTDVAGVLVANAAHAERGGYGIDSAAKRAKGAFSRPERVLRVRIIVKGVGKRLQVVEVEVFIEKLRLVHHLMHKRKG